MIKELAGETVVGVSMNDRSLSVYTKTGRIFRVYVDPEGRLFDKTEKELEEDVIPFSRFRVDVGDQIISVPSHRVIAIYAEDKRHVIEFIKNGVATEDKHRLTENDISSGLLPHDQNCRSLDSYIQFCHTLLPVSRGEIVNWKYVLGYRKEYYNAKCYHMYLKTPSFREITVSQRQKTRINAEIKNTFGFNCTYSTKN